jgi:hypothetical protein
MSQSPNRARAIAFPQSHGSSSERTRLRVLLEGAQPTDEEVAAILAGQRADGGWASEDGPSGDAHTTLEALWALHVCGRDRDGAA